MLPINELKNLISKHPMELDVVSSSMEPLIKSNSKITVVATEFSKLRKFDVIVFWKDSQLTCHYIKHINCIKVQGRKILITQGLNCTFEDLPVFEDDVFGMVISHQISTLLRLKIMISELIKRAV